MPGERFDYSKERRRHEMFVGRTALLARLDQLLIADRSDRWVVLTGGPGMGKSALLTAWLARREAAGARVPHHFIRRGEYDWDDPAKLVGSLMVQLEDGFPDERERDDDARMHPATRLDRALSRVSRALVRRGERLVILVDGLDEYDPPAGTLPGDPLAAFLPHALPGGVSFLCACRPRHPYVSSLEARDGELVRIDLDAPGAAGDNDATVRAYWASVAGPLGLDAPFIDAAVQRAGGNLQHAVQLRKRLALPAAQRRVEDIPRGLAALLERAWDRVAADAVVVDGLGILCAAREALTLDELGRVAGWAGDAERRRFVRGARELLRETVRSQAHGERTTMHAAHAPGDDAEPGRFGAEVGEPEYQLHHDSIRGYIAQTIGSAALRGHHGALAQRLATWPARADAMGRRYALRHALIHRAEAGTWDDAWRIAGDTSYLEAKGRVLGMHEAEADVARTAERCRASGNALSQRFDDLARALTRESHRLHRAPEETAALVWNRLRRSGWSVSDLDVHLHVSPSRAAFLHVRHTTMRESPALVRDLTGHAHWVNACAVTPDGRQVISASNDGTLRLWDLESGRALVTVEAHRDFVRACAVAPDGRRVVSASDDGTLKVWDLESGRALATLKGHIHSVTACAVTPDGRRVVSASGDRTLKVWDLDGGCALATLKGHAVWVTACAVTPDGGRVVSASRDHTLKIWDLESGCVLATLEGHPDGVSACAVTPDGRHVVSASNSGTLKVWDLASGRVLDTFDGHTERVRACAVTPDGRRVISASDDRTLKVWDLASGRAVAILDGHAERVRACAVTPDGRRVVSASGDQTLKVWDLANQHPLSTPDGHDNWVSACAVTPDGRRVVSASGDRTLKVRDLETGRGLATLQGHAAGVNACAVAPDGRRVVSASRDRTLKVWDLESGRAIVTLQGHAGGVSACAVTPDGRRVVSASDDRTLKIWDLDGGRTLATLEGHAGGVSACAVTPDGRRVISASDDRTLKVWDLERGRVLATLEGHAHWVSACAVTPDGRRVVSASWDHTLKVWDLASGRVLATLEGHTHWVNACAVTPDGKRVVSASTDRTLKLWDLETHACCFTHQGDAPYNAVAATLTVLVAGDTIGIVWILDGTSTQHRTTPAAARDIHRVSGSPQAPQPPRAPMSKHTILFLAANPLGTDRLALDREARAIQVELERSGHRDSFELVTRWAVEPHDLLRELRKLKPTIVHFSGHGGAATLDAPVPGPMRQRDVVVEPALAGDELSCGLYFQGADGRPQRVSTAALEQTFGAAGASVQLVVLNACYSEVHAAALLAHVACVIGSTGPIDDHAARNFAIGFYGGLGERESVAAAYEQGRAAISLAGLPDADRLLLKARADVDPDRLQLAR